MSSNYTIGVGYPVFKRVDKSRNVITNFAFPDCNAEGQPEITTFDGLIIRKRLNGKTTIARRYGNSGMIRLKWQLRYPSYISGEDMKFRLEPILNACLWPERYDVILQPHNEIEREYKVYLSSEELVIEAQKGDELTCQGMKIEGDIEFSTVELHELDWPLIRTESDLIYTVPLEDFTY